MCVASSSLLQGFEYCSLGMSRTCFFILAMTLALPKMVSRSNLCFAANSAVKCRACDD